MMTTRGKATTIQARELAQSGNTRPSNDSGSWSIAFRMIAACNPRSQGGVWHTDYKWPWKPCHYRGYWTNMSSCPGEVLEILFQCQKDVIILTAKDCMDVNFVLWTICINSCIHLANFFMFWITNCQLDFTKKNKMGKFASVERFFPLFSHKDVKTDLLLWRSFRTIKSPDDSLSIVNWRHEVT